MMTRIMDHDKAKRLPHGSVALIGNFGPTTAELLGINASIASFGTRRNRPVIH